MKKNLLLAFAALALGVSSVSAQEVTYVEDCSQGTLLNKNKDNWFITVEGGANMLFGKHDIDAKIKDRIAPNAALYVGKWVTPTMGVRVGANWIMPKGATTENGMYRKMNADAIENGIYPEKFMGVGPEFDVMLNLTNWWCGYRPNRVYNAVVYVGAGAYWTSYRGYGNKPAVEDNLHWRNAHNTLMFATIGWSNNFRLSKHVDLFLDLKYELIDFKKAEHLAMAQIGLNFNLGKTEWNCPVTAVCPTWKYTDAEGDALVARLAAAENKVANLQQQLDACLNRPVKETKVMDCEGLATVYYPINQSGLSSREKTILKSVAQVMQENPDKKYILTGYADNYTGTEEINARLRNARVDGVKNFLVSCGVNADQLDATVDNNNLTDYGVKAAPLDRAVTIRLAD